MQSVHESFTNYEFHEFHELACADRLLRTRISRISRIDNYDHKSHELACCAGKNHGDIFFVFKNNIVINSFPV